LDSLIRRLEAQRSCLDWACREISSRDGLVLELGLGNGRTYDHLRRALPTREFFVFERALARQTLLPDETQLILGDIYESLPLFTADHRGLADLIHSDIGSGDATANAALAAFLAPYFAQLLAPGGLVLADQEIWPQVSPGTLIEALAPPREVPRDRYFVYGKI
jgi:hypothetical protein